jgi:hypothetical protein
MDDGVPRRVPYQTLALAEAEAPAERVPVGNPASSALIPDR